MNDYLIGQRVVALIKLEDQDQDFTELDVLENGVILGDSIMFKEGRLSLVGIGTTDGRVWFDKNDISSIRPSKCKKNGLFVYYIRTGILPPPPWECEVLKYRIESVGKGFRPDRFLKK